MELRNGLTAEELVCRLLIRRGIYTRTCDDKKGLEPGKFLRIAARNRPENAYIIRSLRRLIEVGPAVPAGMDEECRDGPGRWKPALRRSPVFGLCTGCIVAR